MEVYKSGMEQALMELEELKMVCKPKHTKQKIWILTCNNRTKAIPIPHWTRRLTMCCMERFPRSMTLLIPCSRRVSNVLMMPCTSWTPPCRLVTRMRRLPMCCPRSKRLLHLQPSSRRRSTTSSRTARTAHMQRLSGQSPSSRARLLMS